MPNNSNLMWWVQTWVKRPSIQTSRSIHKSWHNKRSQIRKTQLVVVNYLISEHLLGGLRRVVRGITCLVRVVIQDL
jgi:hypothetical protein